MVKEASRLAFHRFSRHFRTFLARERKVGGADFQVASFGQHDVGNARKTVRKRWGEPPRRAQFSSKLATGRFFRPVKTRVVSYLGQRWDLPYAPLTVIPYIFGPYK
jgi:hypothetical protein